MYGLLFDCIERYVIAECGTGKWTELVKDCMGDSNFRDCELSEVLVKLTSILKLDEDNIVEEIGHFFLDFLR
jgi:hypothetical protein